MAACFVLAPVGYTNNQGSTTGDHNPLICKLCLGGMPVCLTPDCATFPQPPLQMGTEEWQWGLPSDALTSPVLAPIAEKKGSSPDVECPQQAQHHCAQMLCRYLAVLQLGLQPAHSNAGGPAAVNGTALQKCSSILSGRSGGFKALRPSYICVH